MLNKFVQMRMQGCSIDAPICNDMGGGGGTNTIQQNSDPWGGVQPYLSNAFQHAYNTANQPSAGGINGGLPGQSQQTLQAQSLIGNRALQGSPLNQAAQQENLATVRGDYLSPDSNPYLRDTVNQAMGDTRSQLNSQFKGDNYGNSVHQEWLAKNMMNTALPFYAQNYNTERQRQVGATALTPTLANQDYADLSQLGNVGAQIDTRSQQAADSQWTQLQKYLAAISGQGGGSSTTQQPFYSNPLASAMGMGIGGLGLYNGLSSAGLLGASGAGASTASAGMGAADLLGTMAMFA